MSDIFSALGDPTRRALLDRLFEKGGRPLNELCEGMSMSRQAVTKHLRILEAAELVVTVRHGRKKLHYLNPVPLSKIIHRWIGKFGDVRIEDLADFREDPKEEVKDGSRSVRPQS